VREKSLRNLRGGFLDIHGAFSDAFEMTGKMLFGTMQKSTLCYYLVGVYVVSITHYSNCFAFGIGWLLCYYRTPKAVIQGVKKLCDLQITDHSKSRQAKRERTSILRKKENKQYRTIIVPSTKSRSYRKSGSRRHLAFRSRGNNGAIESPPFPPEN
jgi:hypothetical protein